MNQCVKRTHSSSHCFTLHTLYIRHYARVYTVYYAADYRCKGGTARMSGFVSTEVIKIFKFGENVCSAIMSFREPNASITVTSRRSGYLTLTRTSTISADPIRTHDCMPDLNKNKKAQLSLTNPRDAKACQNCSNSTCLQRR